FSPRRSRRRGPSCIDRPGPSPHRARRKRSPHTSKRRQKPPPSSKPSTPSPPPPTKANCHARAPRLTSHIPAIKLTLQISYDETRGVVGQRVHRLVRKRMMKHGAMRQRLDRSHAHKRRKIQVGNANFVAMALEVSLEQCIIFAGKSFLLLKLSDA